MSVTGARQAAAEEAAKGIMRRLEAAWNRADGAAFGEPFSADADFVTIQGHHHSGRDAIAGGHQRILGTVYAGSTIGYQVLQARQLAERVILAQVRATLEVPDGPLAGEHSSIATAVLVERGGEVEITAFHNTLVTD